MRTLVVILGLVVLSGWMGALARAEAEGEVPPPPMPSPQTPAAQLAAPPKQALTMPAPPPQAQAQTVTLHLVASPAAPIVAAPPPAPQAVTLNLAAAPVPSQTVTLQVVPTAAAVAPIAAAPPPVQAQVRHAGPLGRAIGAVGECLMKKGWDTVKVPPSDPGVSVQQVRYEVAQPPVQQVQIMQAVPVSASPQSCGVKSLFRR